MNESPIDALNKAIQEYVKSEAPEAFVTCWGVGIEYTSLELTRKGLSSFITAVPDDQSFVTSRGLFNTGADDFTGRRVRIE